jgi:hypothetical protein
VPSLNWSVAVLVIEPPETAGFETVPTPCRFQTDPTPVPTR